MGLGVSGCSASPEAGGDAGRRVTPVNPRDVLDRPARKPDAVLTYGKHPDQLLDVHLPPRPVDGAAPAPVVVFLHGGFWRQAFDRTHTRPLAEALAAEGYVVVTPEFRRSGGDGGYPETFDDVAAALDAVPTIESVAPGRADLADVTLAGHSAGGHLAMWAALRPGGLSGGLSVRRVVALAPVAALVSAYERGLDGDAVEALMGGSPAELPAAYAAADPSRMLPGAVPITVIHGDRDDRVPVEMSRALTGVSYVELDGMEHFGLIDPLSTAWPAVLAAIKG
ncbi:MAG: alpha/beta fold hydrolase [Propionibacteriales bacterium]|nr:alpha/beta fold hydrolase [Propionibacteriales bacterium]